MHVHVGVYKRCSAPVKSTTCSKPREHTLCLEMPREQTDNDVVQRSEVVASEPGASWPRGKKKNEDVPRLIYSNRGMFSKKSARQSSLAFEIHHEAEVRERLERRFVIFTLATCVRRRRAIPRRRSDRVI